jgi:hypothetical protein
VFAIRVSPCAATADADPLPASDKAPATPNTVTAFARLLRFEARFACDIVDLPFKLGRPELECNAWAGGPIEKSRATGAACALRHHRRPSKLETKLVRIPFRSAERTRRGNRPFEAYRRRDRGGLLVPVGALPGLPPDRGGKRRVFTVEYRNFI